jgi:hypothetical protein
VSESYKTGKEPARNRVVREENRRDLAAEPEHERCDRQAAEDRQP